MRWLRATAAGLLIGAAVTMAPANAEPSQPDPTTTSTSDELADMVMDVIQRGDPAAPTTTPVPEPPH